jgi:hypothetical protein
MVMLFLLYINKKTQLSLINNISITSLDDVNIFMGRLPQFGTTRLYCRTIVGKHFNIEKTYFKLKIDVFFKQIREVFRKLDVIFNHKIFFPKLSLSFQKFIEYFLNILVKTQYYYLNICFHFEIFFKSRNFKL